MGRELRSALGNPDAQLYRTLLEPHERGSILVAAVFDGFFATYQRRIRDLLRIATGGSGLLPAGDLHPDLVNRIAGEATRAAQAILSMCIRAFDYLPPVDVTFGDYLRAMITADYELLRSDETGQRAAIIEGFRQRGIFPDQVASLAEESLLWPPADASTPPIPVDKEPALLEYMIRAATGFGRVGLWRQSADYFEDEEGEVTGLTAAVAQSLQRYADQHRSPLRLHPTLPVQVRGFHVVFRVAPTGQSLIELVAQFVQTDRSTRDEFGGIPLRGGSTVVTAANGQVRYVLAKPLPSDALAPESRAQADARVERSRQYLAAADGMDPRMPYATPEELSRRAELRASLQSLHWM
jgi:hypothetical protein